MITYFRSESNRSSKGALAPAAVSAELRPAPPPAASPLLSITPYLTLHSRPQSAEVKQLQKHGEERFVVPTSSLVVLPKAKPVQAVHLTRFDLCPVAAAGNRERAPWESAIVLAMARVRVEVSGT